MMMSNDKLPDYYVENRSLKEYPTEVGAPKFSPDNISLFKQEKTFKLKKRLCYHYIKTSYCYSN